MFKKLSVMSLMVLVWFRLFGELFAVSLSGKRVLWRGLSVVRYFTAQKWSQEFSTGRACRLRFRSRFRRTNFFCCSRVYRLASWRRQRGLRFRGYSAFRRLRDSFRFRAFLIFSVISRSSSVFRTFWSFFSVGFFSRLSGGKLAKVFFLDLRMTGRSRQSVCSIFLFFSQYRQRRYRRRFVAYRFSQRFFVSASFSQFWYWKEGDSGL